MTTYRKTTTLSKPIDDEQIPFGTLGYFRARNKRRAYSLVMSEFKKSGISQATLARRLGKKPDVVCRLLSGPGNWGLDTHSDLLFAICGGVPTYGIDYPLDKPPQNFGPREKFDFKVHTDSTQATLTKAMNAGHNPRQPRFNTTTVNANTVREPA